MKKHIFIILAISLITLVSALEIEITNPGVQTNRIINLEPIKILVEDFLDLTDTPSSYSGSSGLCVVVNSAGSGVEFVACNSTASGVNASDFVRRDGTTGLTGNWDVGDFNITLPHLIIDAPFGFGVPPMTITSQDQVDNLNAELLGGDPQGVSGDAIANLGGSNTWGAPQTYSNVVTIQDNVNHNYGTSLDSMIEWFSGGTRDYLFIGTETGSDAQTGYIIIGEKGQQSNIEPSDNVANPTLRIHSDDAFSDDWIEFSHDQTNPIINWSNGNLKMAGGDIEIDNGNLNITNNLTVNTIKDSSGNIWACKNDTGVYFNGAC